MDPTWKKTSEWLEADGLGGFSSGTVSGIRTRRYHALLLTAMTPPTGRVVLVNGFDAWVETPAGTFALSSQHYTPEVVHPDGVQRIVAFKSEPWPQWVFALEDGTRIEQEIFVPHRASAVALSWRVRNHTQGVTLSVRPLFSGRDYHALHRENPLFRFEPEEVDGGLVWRPYLGLPGITAVFNGTYLHQPEWYRNFLYEEERTRGLDHVEDLASPGIFHWDLSAGEGIWMLAAVGSQEAFGLPETIPELCFKDLRAVEERRRRKFSSRLHRSADAYLVSTGKGRVQWRDSLSGQARGERAGKKKQGKTLVAGYPWFTDWGRDTFISMRGLCLATGRLDAAREILLEWAGTVSEGMVPNRFPDAGNEPEYNSVDASLWYTIAVYEFVQAMTAQKRKIPVRDRRLLQEAVEAILSGYARGTRFGIHADADGLLAAGQPGVQLTWMDAKIGDWVVTPRIGKPVEVQALWLNALWIGSAWSGRWKRILTKGCESFSARFWNETGGYLCDVVDVDHQPGTVDATFRPNQIFAIGGVPVALLRGNRARQIVESVESRLWTRLGLRSLAPGEPGYVPHYVGGVRERDAAYHQGSVWPWLAGPFIEAWVRSQGGTCVAKRIARDRYLAPLLDHLDEAGLGHVSEIADAEPPHTPRGCPFQAWSLGEVLRLSLVVLADGVGILPLNDAEVRRRTSAGESGEPYGTERSGNGRSTAS